SGIVFFSGLPLNLSRSNTRNCVSIMKDQSEVCWISCKFRCRAALGLVLLCQSGKRTKFRACGKSASSQSVPRRTHLPLAESIMLNPHEKVEPVNVAEEVSRSFLDYSMSVIISRALPDARDGLKPSQRRILYAMHDLSLFPGRQHRKCAKICGDTSGNYHPHGEAVIYPTL